MPVSHGIHEAESSPSSSMVKKPAFTVAARRIGSENLIPGRWCILRLEQSSE